MSGDTRRLLLLFSTTGYEAGDFAAAAEKLHVACVFGSDRCHVMEDPWQDGALPLHFEDPGGSARTILEYSRTTPVHAIVAVGDRPTVTAALACRALGLPHNPPEAVEAARNKFLARQRLQAAGLAVPPFARFRIDQDPRDAARQVPFPCVLKPLALSASRGVIRTDDPDAFVTAFRRIAALLRSPELRVLREEAHDWILVEGFIEGREVALEGLLDRGRVRLLALFDKPDPLDGPYFEETIYVTPSRLQRGVQEQIFRATEQAAGALGLVHGPIHAELRLSPAGPRVLEVAARSIGGLCSRVLRFGTGLSLEELILRHAFGMDVGPFHREASAAGVMMIPIPEAGVYRRVEGLEEARRTAGIEELTITAKEGQKLLPLPEGSSYLGFIFARGTSPEQVEDALRRAHAQLRFEIVPSLDVTPSPSSSEPAATAR
ncbi:MAG TPA: ATP-grasp domain-containing protein [Candidatus Methylomirabilis sp.]|jgi:biotin carboxylase|nr:ATP-grasp domain-containing protein [Candidatus Methylomirabilis sp.]